MIIDSGSRSAAQESSPLTKKELFARLRQIIGLGWQEIPAAARYNGTGGAGNFLEDLIGLKAGNQDIADAIGWEVKFSATKTNYITLFHKEPSPKGVMQLSSVMFSPAV